jgi:EPS-associated MarR family transcriptional regulator
MIEQSEKEEILSIIKEIETDPAVSQRAVSRKLGISLGKTNYLLKELIKKGRIKVKSFSHNPGKLKKIHYILTKDGFAEKFRLTHHFLLKKEAEYNRLKQEWERLNGKELSTKNPEGSK